MIAQENCPLWLVLASKYLYSSYGADLKLDIHVFPMVINEVLRIENIRTTFFCCYCLMALYILVIFLVSKTLTSRHVLNINDISLVFFRFIKSLFFGSAAQGFPGSSLPDIIC